MFLISKAYLNMKLSLNSMKNFDFNIQHLEIRGSSYKLPELVRMADCGSKKSAELK